jgi:predicted permease
MSTAAGGDGAASSHYFACRDDAVTAYLHEEAVVGSLIKDLKFGARALAKKPGSAVVAILAFGLGIGLCTTMFSIIYGVFFRGLGVPEPDRIVLLMRTNPSEDVQRMGVTPHDLYDWREQQQSFEGLAGYYVGTVNITGPEGPERYRGGFVNANTFDLLRVQPVIGRTFQAADDLPGAPFTLLLGYSVWRERYEGDPAVVGTTLKVNGKQATIIGVMPRGFRFPQDQDLWVPLGDRRSRLEKRGDGTTLDVIGRLKEGVTVEQAKLEFELITQRLAQEYPDSNEGVGALFTTIVEQNTGPELVALLSAMMVATVFVLLIACSNVANLLLSRAALRTKEAAVRSALGASSLSVIFPFFSEALLLSGVGGALGTGIGYYGVYLFNAAIPPGKPYYMEITLDLPILLFVFGITLLTSLASGAAPAVQISRPDVNAILKDEARGSSSLQLGKLSKVLVVGEVALSCALLVGAGLMTKNIVALRNLDYNFAIDDVFTARVGLFETDYPDAGAQTQFYRNLVQRLEAMPAARSVALTTNLPAAGAGRPRVAIEGETYETDQDHPRAYFAAATPNFFQTFGVNVLQGRDFTLQDDSDAPLVAIVNQRFAERFFPGENAVGRRFRDADDDGENDWKSIIGVVPNLMMQGFGPQEDPAGYYVPLAQHDTRFISIAVAARGGAPMTMTPEVRRAIRTVDPDLPMYWVYSMPEVINNNTWPYTVFGALFIAFGAAALFMASVGLYGVLSFSVSRRVQEMGIRMALGAAGRDVVKLVLRQGFVQIGIGLGIGLVMAFGLSNVVAILMFQGQTRDPMIFAAITFVIVIVGILASIVPARRATSVDPIVALRYE